MLPNYQARSPFVLKHTTSMYMYICLYVWIVRMPYKRARRELFSSKNTAF